MSIWVDVNGWPIPPIILLGCLVVEGLYFRGWRVLLKEEQAKETARAIIDSERTDSHAGTYRWNSWSWRGAYFLGSIIALILAASAPVDTLSSRLFGVHMVQHLLLLVVVAPLFVAGAPLLPVWLGLPRWTRSLVEAFVNMKTGRAFYRACYKIGYWLRYPAVSCVLLIIGMWVWHWPPLYDLALTNDAIHDWCEHSTFLAVSILFWTQVIPSPPLRPRLGYLGRMGCLGVAIAQNVMLSAVLGFAPAPLYAPYAHLGTVLGGFSPLQDQQFGAGIMWTAGDLPFGIAFSILIQRWLALFPDDSNIAVKSHQNSER